MPVTSTVLSTSKLFRCSAFRSGHHPGRDAVTTRCRVGGSTDGFRSAATVGDIVRYNVPVPPARWRAVVASILAFWVVVVGAEWALPGVETTHHGPHASAAGPHGGFAVVADHPHFESGSTPLAPDTVAEAALPRATVTLIALALIGAIAAVLPFWRQASLSAIRGPPRRLAAPASGRVLLTRLCIARR